VTRQIERGIVKRIDEKAGKVRYEVLLEGGHLTVVNHRLIQPEPSRRLALGTVLMVEHNAGAVIRALRESGVPPTQPSGDQDPEQERTLEVVQADRANGTFAVNWAPGQVLRIHVSPDNAIWNRIRIGTSVRVTRKTGSAGAPKFSAAVLGKPHSVEPKTVPPPGTTSQKASAPRPRPAPVPTPASKREVVPAPNAKPGVAPPPRISTTRVTRPAPVFKAPPKPPAGLPPGTPIGSSGEPGEVERPISCPDLVPIFGPGGPVARLLGERYRPRQGQIEMAGHVRTALQERRHAVIEAGTGIGKSFAYLVPVIWSGARAVVSTSNKALMSQLWHKDLPALSKIAPRPFVAALLKGRSNYLCALRLQELFPARQLPGLISDQELVERGLSAVPSGDCEEMRLPVHLVQRLTVDHRECGGFKCPKYDECFYEWAKEMATQADIVVTNHALLCISTLLQENKPLPVRPVLIIDEAHELEGYAINALTQALAYDTLGGIVNHPFARDAATPEIRRQAMEWNQALFEAVDRQRPNRASTTWAMRDEIQQGLALWAALNSIQKKLKTFQVAQQEQGKLDALVRFVEDALATVHALANPEPPTAIRYCTLDDGNGSEGPAAIQMQYRPLEVSETLGRTLFGAWPRVISTSATLSIDGDLGWFARRVGVPQESGPLSARISSPFDYPKNVLIYTPQGLIPAYGDETEEQYVGKLGAEVTRLIRASDGRAFVLCTSRKRMQQLYQRLAHELSGYLCLCQGKGLSRTEMVEQFESHGHAVLFGTRSFWEGVDIPGEALSLVILDKLPFLPLDDPVLKRQETLVAARGGNPFAELQLGHAILTLRQGAGRLIRSESDRGVIALLDSRVNDKTKTYGEKIIRSLPNGRRVFRFEDVQAFFAGGSVTSPQAITDSP
jgi:ATP-dependent DNA helicase DinG